MEPSDPVQLYIAPWALAKESIPIHVSWKEGFDFTGVGIKIPEGFAFDDFLNLGEVKFDKRECFIEKSNIIGAGKSNFFGFVIRYERIPNEMRHIGKVQLDFKSTTGQRKFELEARVFRPFIECTSAPSTIELKDDSTTELPLFLKYRGFGDIELTIVGRIGGKIVSRDSSVALEVVKRLWMAETSEEAKQSTEQQVEIAKKQKLTVDDGYIREIADQVQRIIESGQLPPETFDKEGVEELTQWLQDTRKKGMFMDLVYTRIEELVLSMLVDLLQSTPASNVSMTEPNPRVWADIKAPIVDLHLFLKYSDHLKNNYDDVEIDVKVIDNRTKSKAVIGIPINIEKWVDEPLHNVAGI